MKPKTGIIPQNSSREFLINELFFSATNRKGVISSGNAVFARVSGYTLEEMVGQPHNMIRHPDMPRAVFKLFWDYLQAGKPVAAYVKNMASDGRYYWVLALAAPIEDGYLSVRLKPTGALFAVMEDVYRSLATTEAEREAAGDDRKTAMQVAGARLEEILRTKGFASYDAFMRVMLQQELASRDAILTKEHRSVFAAQPELTGASGKMDAALRVIYQEAQQVHGRINALCAQLESSVQLNVQLSTQSRSILRLTDEFRFTPLNVAIKSSQMGDAGLSLGVIASHLGEASAGVVSLVSGLTDQAEKVSTGLGESLFNLGWARLQFEMTIVYYHEMLVALCKESSGATSATQRNQLSSLAHLRFAFSRTTERAVKTLIDVEKILRGLNAAAEDLRKAMLSIQVIHVAGLIEASRLTDDGSFKAIFDDIRQHIECTRKELVDFNDVIGRLSALARQTPVILRTVTGAAARMKQDEETLISASAQEAVAKRNPTRNDRDPAELLAAASARNESADTAETLMAAG